MTKHETRLLHSSGIREGIHWQLHDVQEDQDKDRAFLTELDKTTHSVSSHLLEKKTMTKMISLDLEVDFDCCCAVKTNCFHPVCLSWWDCFCLIHYFFSSLIGLSVHLMLCCSCYCCCYCWEDSCWDFSWSLLSSTKTLTLMTNLQQHWDSVVIPKKELLQPQLH